MCRVIASAVVRVALRATAATVVCVCGREHRHNVVPHERTPPHHRIWRRLNSSSRCPSRPRTVGGSVGVRTRTSQPRSSHIKRPDSGFPVSGPISMLDHRRNAPSNVGDTPKRSSRRWTIKTRQPRPRRRGSISHSCHSCDHASSYRVGKPYAPPRVAQRQLYELLWDRVVLYGSHVVAPMQRDVGVVRRVGVILVLVAVVWKTSLVRLGDAFPPWQHMVGRTRRLVARAARGPHTRRRDREGNVPRDLRGPRAVARRTIEFPATAEFRKPKAWRRRLGLHNAQRHAEYRIGTGRSEHDTRPVERVPTVPTTDVVRA